MLAQHNECNSGKRIALAAWQAASTRRPQALDQYSGRWRLVREVLIMLPLSFLQIAVHCAIKFSRELKVDKTEFYKPNVARTVKKVFTVQIALWYFYRPVTAAQLIIEHQPKWTVHEDSLPSLAHKVLAAISSKYWEETIPMRAFACWLCSLCENNEKNINYSSADGSWLD